MVPDLDALAREFGLEDENEAIKGLAQWSVRLAYSDVPRRSRLGGVPDLLPSASWPLQNDKHPHPGDPMLFVGQLGLADLAGLEIWTGPQDGLLSFFCASDPEMSGYVPEEDSAVVLFTEPVESVERRTAPPSRAPISLAEISIEVSGLDLTLPGPEAPVLKQFGLEWYQNRGERYWELHNRLDELRPASLATVCSATLIQSKGT